MMHRRWARLAVGLIAAASAAAVSPAAQAAGPAPAAPAPRSGGSSGAGSSTGTAADSLPANATNAGSNAPRVFPSGSYFLHIAMMHDGDYQKALDGFRSDFTFGLQAAGTHWVDSICYLTMAGECLNRMGRPAEALDDYNAA